MKKPFENLLRRSKFLGTILLPLASVIFLYGCSRPPSGGAILASAGGKNLYLSQVAGHVDTSSAYAVRNYVSNWVDQQLLFDEAKKEGLNDNHQFRDRVDEFAQQLAVTMLLNKRIYDVSMIFSPDSISNYYSAHQQEFRAGESTVLVNYVAFDKRSTAVSFRNSVVSGQGWSASISQVPSYRLLAVKDSVYMKGSSTSPPIWSALQSFGDGSVSFPIQVNNIVYIVQVIKWYAVGQLLPIACVANSIREKLAIEQRTRLYTNLLDSLRSNGNFEINPAVAIRDTGAQE